MSSLDWNKKCDVVSISELYLRSLGFTTKQINSLSDDDMQAKADGLSEELSKAVGGLSESVRCITSLYLAERGYIFSTKACAQRGHGDG